MFETSVPPELKRQIHQIIEENPSTMPTHIASQLGISEAATIFALPKTMRTFVDVSHFDAIWEALCHWEKVTFLKQTPTAIIEVKGKLPKGKYAHGYFNLIEKGNPLGGHLMVNKLGSICFLEKPFFGLESLSVQFFDQKGDHMFAIYAGREKRELIPSVKVAFYTLRSQYQRKPS